MVAEAIRVYLTRHDAWDRPLYLAGESDGVTRAMLVAEVLEHRGMPVRGVVLVSYNLDLGTPPAAYPEDALDLPQFTAAAHYHRLRKAMDQDPQLCVLTLRGRYDGWPCESSVETTRAAGPRYAARVTHLCLQGGYRWVTEGTAEFYSLLLSLRAGVYAKDAFLQVINHRADGYYDNPFGALDNRAAGERFWKDARAQRVPYGRGFMYLVSVDAQLRQHGRQAHSVDDLVLEVLKRQRAGETIGVPEWRAMVVRELGADAGAAFDAMVAGKPIVPAAPAFGCYRVVPAPHRPFELGFDRMRMGVVKNLLPDSAAARAGVQENDRIVAYTPLEQVMADEHARMQLKLERDGKPLQVDYLPRSARVDAWRFAVDPALAARCSP
ncbi:hypothetical protein [Xanthomonas theicola]|uniref:PDZ domain-containing protein n=1 Tax=Xanthomonas theicola TaxID=56464 RepID=A0A2S6ZJM0_9XANT|nr:hypothetical protein [Xanthomonas theicola]PPT92320.1 hypothetical protein XthCFBP4691_04325 [Xanthomonas theicola]QNH23657.1 hypothetical protein G4Q83_01190 [Xanthomonas theicola]